MFQAQPCLCGTWDNSPCLPLASFSSSEKCDLSLGVRITLHETMYENTGTLSGQGVRSRNDTPSTYIKKKKDPTQAQLTHTQGSCPWLWAYDVGSQHLVGGDGSLRVPKGLK